MPECLPHRNTWPFNPVTADSPESKAESKVIREALVAATVDDKANKFDQLLDWHNLRRTLWVCNCRQLTPRVVGWLTVAELEFQTALWIR